jgi:THO complex subunit 2
MELGMLRTLLKVAGGYSFADYSPAASLNESQLEGRSGSVLLKRETMSFGIFEKTNPAAVDHVRRVLQTDGLGVSLLILIAQARDRIIFDSAKGALKEVKLIGNLYDTCQVIMSILFEFLTEDDDNGKEMDGGLSNDCHISMYSRFLPSFQDLLRNYGLDVATAWLLCRPCVKAALEMESEDLEKSALARFELSEDVRKSYSDSLPESVWNVLTPQLFEFFYMTSLGDISCPQGVLTSEISRIDKEIERIQGLKPPVPRNDSRELERLKTVSKQLSVDMKNQKDHVESTLKGLKEGKTNFFTSEEVSREAARAFLMYCIYPRTTQSPDDAMYSAAIAFRLHRIWTPGFSIMHYLDELISIVSGAFFGVTEAEAANLAILLWQTVKVVNNWRHEDGLYDKDVLGKPGSYMESTEDGETSINRVSHKDFIELYNKWQYSLADALIGCLQSTEYIHTRTGLVVLSRLVHVFPTGPSLGNKLLKVLEPLQDESSRPDIRASARAYGMMLVKARDEGKWIEEDEAAAKARAEKEKAAAEERKKKIEKSFQELERENEKIAAQIGTDDRRDRDRPRGGTRAVGTENSRQGGGRDTPGKNPGSNRTGSDYPRVENGRDRRGDDRDRRGDDRDRRGDDRDRRADDRDRRTSRDRDLPSSREKDDDMKDDRGRGTKRGGGDDDRRGGGGGGDVSQRGGGGGGRDDGAVWRRGEGSGATRNPKRSRPSSPVDDRDTDRPTNAKRPRNDDYNSYPSRRSGPSSRSRR